jgi:uncharacterized protein (TIGR01568 family)
MPAPSWFQKLRRRRKKKKQSPCRSGQGDGAARTSASSANNNCASPSRQCQAPSSSACAVSPNRASYYFPSADRARQDGGGERLRHVVVARRDTEAAALDVGVDVVHRRAGDRRRLGGLDAPPGTPELKLRPIVARHDASDDGAGSATTSAATTPSTRARGFHVKPAGRRRHDHDGGARKDRRHLNEKAAAADEAAPTSRQHGGARRRRWLYESLVVVKVSSDPERELAESMAEMVLANGIRESDDLEELLACYLALNAAEHHRAVVAAFRRVWLHLARHVVQPPASQTRALITHHCSQFTDTGGSLTS